ncbi:MAG: alpha-galactosidase, partial [Holdemanella sp.]|nr:alpha-galactosidase [Holdemanella sp.]
MSILYNEVYRTISLNTKNTTYQMKINEYNFLIHTYYGKRISDADMSYLYKDIDRACAGQPDEVCPERVVSFNILPQEFTGYGVGDYRVNSIAVKNPDGSYAADFRYVGHRIESGKYSIPGLPATYDNGGEAETLIVTIKDKHTGLRVDLYYGVFENADIITRATRFINEGDGTIKLLKADSMCLDILYGKWDMINFWGRHALERQLERRYLRHAIETVGSNRGTSSHQQNPFVILCDHEANEDYGSCYGFMLVYSGGFNAEFNLDQLHNTRIVMGIQNDQFEWDLVPGDMFAAPEVIMTYSANGLTPLSQNYHSIIRNNICRGQYKVARRPVLLNNWEATYFDFDDRKLVSIAREAKALGVELLVLDDGWFGIRNDDNSGLGDWYVNEDKIQCGLPNLIKEINDMGLKFGIWVEPEMVNEESNLYKAHPDWALKIPGRIPVRARNQLVLDITRKDVRDYLYERLSTLLKENNIEYVKWDMNR